MKLSGRVFQGRKPPKVSGKGYAGYDNPRENIDPHIRTKAISAKELHGVEKICSITIEAPGGSEDIGLIYTQYPITITEITSVCRSGATPSCDYTIRFGSDRSAAGTEVLVGGWTETSSTTGTTSTWFNNASVPKNNFVWIELSGVPSQTLDLHVTIKYRID